MKRLIKKLLPRRLVGPFLPVYHWLRAVAANVLSGFPARKLKVVAVTGTNGKTTTVLYIARMLEAAGYKVGYSTSLELKIGDKVIAEKSSGAIDPGTTRDAFLMQKLMRRMKSAKVDWVVLEVTSHALAQHRTWGIPIHTAVLTNLTPDHLDYHITVENYMTAKAKLFKMAHHNRVLNHDDEHFEYFAKQGRAGLLTYGRDKKSDVLLTKATPKSGGYDLKITHDKSAIQAETHLPGEFNAMNALSAAATGVAIDLEDEAIQKGLGALKNIPGRMERLETKRGFDVIIDYAHDPAAFQQVFASLRQTTKGRLIAVFGGHAQHDFTGLGREAGKGADILVITDDEPEHMNPAKIRKSIVDAARKFDSKKQILDIADRSKGIKKAFELAKKDDVVLLLALGHQNYRRIGDKKVPWSDRTESEKLLKKKKLLK